MMPLNDNPLVLTDSYKVTHALQYPPGTTSIYSYLEARTGAEFPWTVFFGLQYFLERYLTQQITMHHVNEAAEIFHDHFSGAPVFNREGWERIVRLHGGHLPVKIQAVPEGMVLPVSNALMTIENTDPACWWLPNYLETLLVEVWYPITVATQSRIIKSVIHDYLVRTGDPGGLPFKLHDFGFRGVSSPESAALGGTAHLVNFLGTDNMAALKLCRGYYEEDCGGYSIPASEHSTITAWGQDGELEAYRNMIRLYGNCPFYACVSDSWDIMAACDMWGTELKQEVLAAEGTLVVRPDSGDPPQMVLDVVKRLMHHFGYETNTKGYDVLHPKVRVIQGDGVDLETIHRVLQTLETNGISADNVSFGMGGALLQRLHRDTLCFAFKCSSADVDGERRDVFKRPSADPRKDSKPGRFQVVEGEHGHVVTIPEQQWAAGPKYLQRVFEDGRVYMTHTLAEIRERAGIGPPHEEARLTAVTVEP